MPKRILGTRWKASSIPWRGLAHIAWSAPLLMIFACGSPLARQARPPFRPARLRSSRGPCRRLANEGFVPVEPPLGLEGRRRSAPPWLLSQSTHPFSLAHPRFPSVVSSKHAGKRFPIPSRLSQPPRMVLPLTAPAAGIPLGPLFLTPPPHSIIRSLIVLMLRNQRHNLSKAQPKWLKSPQRKGAHTKEDPRGLVTHPHDPVIQAAEAPPEAKMVPSSASFFRLDPFRPSPHTPHAERHTPKNGSDPIHASSPLVPAASLLLLWD